MKRAITVFLVLVMVLGLFPGGVVLPVSAAEVSGYCGGEGDGTNLTWTLTEDGTLTIEGTGAMEDYTRYSSVPWVSCRDSIEVVVVGDSVTTIGSYAFCDYDALTSVTIGDSVTTMGKYAFHDCDALASVAIPDSVTTIGNYAFYDCYALTSVTIGDGVTTIGVSAFTWCSALTSVTMGDSVTTIGDRAFYNCDALTQITVDSGNENYCDIDGVLFNKDKTTLITYPAGKAQTSYMIPGSVTTISDEAFYNCESLISVTIPNSVTTIGDYAFYFCRALISVTLPDSVTTIGDDAFANCYALTFVTIPDSVATIGDYAFRDCDALASVTIPDSVETIGKYAFSECDALTQITVDSGNENYCDIDGVLFNKDKTTLITYPAGKAQTSYMIPGSVTTISDEAFYNCESLISVTIPNSVTIIGEGAFEWCDSLTSVTIGDSVTNISDYVFAWCTALASVTIGNSVTIIGEGAFCDCDSLTSVTIGDSVTTIGDDAFYGCDALTSVTIPDSVTTIGDYAFYDCDDVALVHYTGTVKQWDEIIIGTYNANLIGVDRHYMRLSANSDGDEIHTGIMTCNDCGITYGETVTEPCADENSDGKCDICDGNVACKHPDTAASAPVFNKTDKTHTVTVICKGCGETVSAETVACTGGTPIVEGHIVTTKCTVCGGAISTETTSCVAGESEIVGHTITTKCAVCGEVLDAETTACVAGAPETVGHTVTTKCAICDEVLDTETTACVAGAPETVGHTVTIKCAICDEVLDTETTACVAGAPETVGHTVTTKCAICGKVLDAEMTDCCDDDNNGKCDICGMDVIRKFNLAGVNMTLGNELVMNFMVYASDLGDGIYSAKITHRSETREVPLSRYNNTYYAVSQAICAKEMADTITVEVFDEDGNAVSEVYTRSVRDYAMSTLEKNLSKKTNTLLVDMLNYGAAAQEFFGYNKEDPAHVYLSDAQRNMATKPQTCKDRREKGKNYYGSNLSLEDKILLNVYFENVTSDMYAKITYTDFRGRMQTITVLYGEFKQLSKNIYGVVVDDIVLGDSFCPIKVTVYNSNGKVYGSATDSVESYCARMNKNGSSSLYNTIMQFASGAKAYFS